MRHLRIATVSAVALTGLALAAPFSLGIPELVVLALGFFVLEISLSRIGYRLGIRRRPL